MATSSSESVGLYGNTVNFGGTYFEWFIFQESATAPATPTGGSWNFSTNVGVPPTGWSTTPPANPTNVVWASISFVNSRSSSTLTWTTPATWVKPGTAGAAATITAGTTTTLSPGASATVANSGTSSAAVFNFGIPAGATGAAGTSATVAVGTTTTGAPGSSATVTNSGTSSAAVFNFSVPAGQGVPSGGSTGQFLAKSSSTNYDTSWITITGVLNYQGAWNASTNTPALASSVGTNGYYYVVSVAGSTSLNGISDWQIGDWAIFNGTVWQKIDQTNLVTSVNGQTGVVSLAYADLAGAIPTWNQNTTGTAANVTGTVAIANGGTGQTTRQDAMDALAGSTTSGQYLRGNGTDVVMSAIQSGDVPTLNQNTTGTAANVTGTVAIANGGTGQTTASAGFNALSPITTTGDLIIGNGSSSATRLGIGANGYLLTSNGTTATWTAAPATGVTSFAGGTTGLTPASATTGAVSLAGTLAVANGGTGRTVGNYSVYANEVHVSNLSGNDTTGDGTYVNPVATITKALTLLTATSRTVIVHPGVYAESPTVSTTNTTITTLELTGANTELTGTLTLSAAARISGLKMANLTITGSGSAYISNCTVDTRVIKSGSNYVEIINSELQCVSGVQITGTGTVSIVGNKCWSVAVSNASANVLIKDCFQVLTPSVTAGTLQFDGCAIFATSPTSNAVTSSAGTFITLANSFVLNSSGTNVERVSLAGSYSIVNLVYDKTNSTFSGTNLNAIDYFSVINADSLVLTNDLPISQGGTGQSTANAALNALLPAQTSNANKYLQTNGTDTSWDAISLSTADITGILPVANGGTGVSASSGASSVMLRDANQNTTINSITEGFVNVAAAGTTTTLTVSSAPNYCVTGSGGQTYRLPDATTLNAGTNYWFNNNQTSGTVVVQNSSGTTIATIQSGGYVEVLLLVNTPAAGTWDVHNYAPSNVSWSTNTFDYPGSITSATWNGATVGVNRGGTGQTTYTDGQLLIGNSTGNTLTKSTLTAGTGISITNGSGAITIAATNSGTVTSVTGTSPVVSSGGATPAISLASSYGDTQNPYASKTANYVLAAPNGSAGVPTFRAIVASDIPTLNQNTTGTAANVTGTVAIANGGTGATTRQDAMDALAGSTTSGQYLRGNGTDVVMSAIQAADVPTLNQNTTGNAATATLATTATNLAGGIASQIPYQTAAGTTSFISNGTAGYVLTSNGTSAPTWQVASGGVSQAKSTAISLIFGL
jgi:hypothetical protein